MSGNGSGFGTGWCMELATTPVLAGALRRRAGVERMGRSEAQCGPGMVPRSRQAGRGGRSGAPCGPGAGVQAALPEKSFLKSSPRSRVTRAAASMSVSARASASSRAKVTPGFRYCSAWGRRLSASYGVATRPAG